MSGDDVVASLRDVTIAYGRTVAVEAVSFDVARGEYVCLIGRNGSGKSTLIRGMLGLVKPRSGRIDIPDGPDATAFLPQSQPGGRDFPATVREIALSGCQTSHRLSPWYTADQRRLARETMDLLGIADLADRRLGSLSGGQRQRTFLARCLCRRPKLLLLDEPYTGLDPQSADSLADLLEQLRRERGIAILMSSHDLGAVAACASRVIVLDGRVLFDGDVDHWLERYKSGRFVGRMGTACTR